MTADAAPPSFYVTVSDLTAGPVLQVHRTSNGAVTATSKVPGAKSLGPISASAGNRTFFVDMSAGGLCSSSRFYRFSLTGAGHITGLARVGSVVSDSIMIAMSASPDGSRIAYVTSNCQTRTAAVHVMNLAGGSVRTWTNTATAATPARVSLMDSFSLSWTADSRTLAVSYQWKPSAAGAVDQAVLALNTASTSGSLQRDSRVLWSQAGCTAVCVNGARISPNGKDLLAQAQLAVQSPAVSVELVQISLPSGKRGGVDFKTSFSFPAQNGAYFMPFWADGSGQYFLVQLPGRFGWIRDGRLVSLPSQSSMQAVAW